MPTEAENMAHEIRLRIQALSDLSTTDLKFEMDDLKQVLIKNPAACALLLPEDIGQAVAAIKKIMTNTSAAALAEKPSSRRTGKTKVDLTLDLSLEN